MKRPNKKICKNYAIDSKKIKLISVSPPEEVALSSKTRIKLMMDASGGHTKY
jgi:hypothetical protein